jgi:hypothetical protein
VEVVRSEESSGDPRRLGRISKQGNELLRFLLVEAAQSGGVQPTAMACLVFFYLATRRGGRSPK